MKLFWAEIDITFDWASMVVDVISVEFCWRRHGAMKYWSGASAGRMLQRCCEWIRMQAASPAGIPPPLPPIRPCPSAAWLEAKKCKRGFAFSSLLLCCELHSNACRLFFQGAHSQKVIKFVFLLKARVGARKEENSANPIEAIKLKADDGKKSPAGNLIFNFISLEKNKGGLALFYLKSTEFHIEQKNFPFFWNICLNKHFES